MLEKLEAIKEKYLEIEAEVSKPETIADNKRYVKLSRSYKELGKVVQKYEQYKNVLSNLKDATASGAAPEKKPLMDEKSSSRNPGSARRPTNMVGTPGRKVGLYFFINSILMAGSGLGTRR